MNIEIQNFGNNGVSLADGKAAISFSIVNADQADSIAQDMANYSRYFVMGDRINLLGYTVATHGIDNMIPNIVKDYIDNNPILPEIIKKQVRIMFGKGVGLYIPDESGDKPTRKWVSATYPDVFNWLDSWDKDPELDSFRDYITRIIHEYYYMEGYYDQWFFNKSRRLVNGNMPIRGLKYKNGVLCRLATTKVIDIHQRILDNECDLVLEGDWRKIFFFQMFEWNRFDPANPFAFPTAVHYVRDRSFNEDIYANPTFFTGQKEWIKGSNLNPKYINSYLENSFNAKVHVIIPDAWIKEKTEAIKKACDENDNRAQANKKLIEEYEGVKIGTEFSFNMVTDLINNKIKECTNVMSGTGKNQGKMFWSRSFLTEHGIEKWTFESIPTSYKEFVDSIISYNKITNTMLLAGKGLAPGISNLTNDGVFNSGSQAYYDYMIYLDSLQYAEDCILEDINRAIWLNFPQLAKARVKLGFIRSAPPRQQDVTASERMPNNNQ